MDATQRVELWEINERHFARFDAKLKQRLAELKADMVNWMFRFWVPTAVGIVATAAGIVALLLRG